MSQSTVFIAVKIVKKGYGKEVSMWIELMDAYEFSKKLILELVNVKLKYRHTVVKKPTKYVTKKKHMET